MLISALILLGTVSASMCFVAANDKKEKQDKDKIIIYNNVPEQKIIANQSTEEFKKLNEHLNDMENNILKF